MASGSGGVSVTASARLRKDYMRLVKDPVPYVLAAPLASNILEWHYCVRGAPDTPYEGGTYHGKLVFPADFPFKPPSIYMLTPNGRFQVNTRLCLSISDFHPDTWNPAWTVGTILNGLLSFMVCEFCQHSFTKWNETSQTLGSIQSTDAEKRALARQSRDYNLKDKVFRELFTDLTAEMQVEQAAEKAAAAAQQQSATSSSTGATKTDDDKKNGAGGTGNTDAVALNSWAYNLCVIIGAIAVAFAVRYVIAVADAT